MRSRTIVVAMSLLVIVASVSSALCAEPEEIFKTAFAVFGASPVACPDSVQEALYEGQTAQCAAVESSFSKFSKGWKRLVKERRDLTHDMRAPWTSEGPLWKQNVFHVNGVPLIVAFSKKNSGMILTYGVATPMCQPMTPGEMDLPFAGTNGIAMPTFSGPNKILVFSPRGSAHVNTRFKIKINKKGRTSILCVLSAEPERYNVSTRVIQSVEAYRYEPLMKDGEPIDVAGTVTLIW